MPNGRNLRTAAAWFVCLVRFPLFWFFIADILVFDYVYLVIYNGPNASMPDAASYFAASKHLGSLLHGTVDTLRTPVYPLFLAVFPRIFSSANCADDYAVMFVQHAVSLFAVFVLYKCTKLLLHRTVFPIWLECLVLIIYLCVCRIYCIGWNITVHSESLGASAVIFFFAVLTSYTYKPSYFKAVSLGLGLLVVIMLRPAFLYLLPLLILYFIGYIVFFRKNWKSSVIGLMMCACTFLTVHIYCYNVYQQCGIFSLTEATYWNLIRCTIQTGLYQYGTDPHVNRIIDEGIEKYKQEYPEAAEDPDFLITSLGWLNDEKWQKLKAAREAKGLYDDISYWNYADALAYVLGKHIPAAAKSEGLTWNDKKGNNYAVSTIKANKLRYAMLTFRKYLKWHPPFRIAELTMLAICLAVLFFGISKVSLQDTYIYGFLIADIFGHYATTFLFAQGDYERLTFPVYSLTFMLGLLTIQRVGHLCGRR